MAETLTKAGRYQIVSELGRGSMGVVYQGYDPVIGRTVAIKTMLTEGLPPQEFQEYKARFQREAQAAGALTHPNIVTVYDFGEDNGVLYLAMELLEGKSLDAIVAEQNILPVETILPMYDQVCSALDHAHAHKIVHRDIKPANIMRLESGLVKVTDFGIAKMMSMGMTQAGQILGTPNYMSPEQVKGRQVDGRSDIFSLGVILYELITGEKPFGGQNITTVIYKIINENPIPPRELDPTIHLGLSYVISKALAKNSDERYQTCRELADDLKNYKNLGGMTAPSATVIIKVPPIGGAQVEPELPVVPSIPVRPPVAVPQPPLVAPVEQPPVRPMSVQVIHPVKSQPRGTSPVAWVLLVLFLLGALGGGGYYIYVHNIYKRMQSAPPVATPPAQPAPSTVTTAPATQPSVTTPEATPSGGTTTAPTQPPGSTTPPTTAENKPPIEAPTAKPEPPKREAEASGGVTVPTPGGSGRSAPAPKIGQLIVTSNIPGARISIDGRSEADWVTPRTISDVPVGTHAVVITKEGYGNVQQSVTIEAGKTKPISVNLAAPSGEVTLETVPPGYEVIIDGKSYGASPVRATLAVGKHPFQIPRPGLPPYESSFEIKYDGHMFKRTVDLGRPVTPTGIVEVRTIPPGATVLADGAPVGAPTPTSFRMAAGQHSLVISLSGHPQVQRTVDVTADGTSVVRVDLTGQ